MKSQRRELMIGAVSERTGVNIETIRYYEKIGMIKPAGRGENGYRRYGRDEINRLKFIRKCRDLGFSLEHTSSLLGLAGNKNRTCQDVSNIAARRLDEVRTKIADLMRMEAVLESFVAQCPQDASPNCPIIATLSDCV